MTDTPTDPSAAAPEPAASEPETPAAKPAAKPGRWKKIVAILAVLTVLLVVAAAIIAPRFVVPYIRNTVIPETEATYGIDIEETGLSISLFTGTASLDSFSLAKDGKTMVEATGLSVNVDIRSLLTDSVIIDKVAASSLTLDLEMQADGQPDLVHVFTDVVTDESPEPADAKPRTIIVKGVDLQQMAITVTGAADSPFADFEFAVTKLGVKGKNLQLSGEDKGLKGQVEIAAGIAATRAGAPILTIGALDVSLDVSSLLYRGDVIMDRASITDVQANVTLGKDGQPEFMQVFAGLAKKQPEAEPEDADAEPKAVRIDALHVANVNLTATCTAESPWPGVVYTLENMSADGTDLVIAGPGDASETKLTVSLRTSATENGKLLYDTGKMVADLNLPELAKGNLIMPSLTVDKPRVHVVLETGPDGTDITNLERILLPKEPPPESNPVIVFGDLRISDGEVIVESQPGTALKGHSMKIVDLRIWGLACQLGGPRAKGEPRGDLRVHAQMIQPHGPARLDALIWGTSLSEADADVDAYVALTGLDIGPWPQLNLVNRSALGGQVLHMESGMKAVGGTIKEGDGEAVLSVRENSTTYPLRFYGPWQAPTVDKNAAMLGALSMQFKRLGSVPTDAGKSILSGGTGAASTVAHGAMDAVTGAGSDAKDTVVDLAKGDVKGAGKGVVSGVGGLIKSVGGTAKDTVVDGAKDVTGGGVGVDPGWWASEFQALHQALVADFVSRRIEAAGSGDREAIRAFHEAFDRHVATP